MALERSGLLSCCILASLLLRADCCCRSRMLASMLLVRPSWRSSLERIWVYLLLKCHCEQTCWIRAGYSRLIHWGGRRFVIELARCQILWLLQLLSGTSNIDSFVCVYMIVGRRFSGRGARSMSDGRLLGNNSLDWVRSCIVRICCCGCRLLLYINQEILAWECLLSYWCYSRYRSIIVIRWWLFRLRAAPGS